MRSFTFACLVGQCSDFQSKPHRGLGNKPSYKDIKLIKNISRKGIAFGAIAALGSSLLAGAPASAVTNVSGLVATTYAGTGTTVIEGTDFVVSTVRDTNYAFRNTEEAGDFRATDRKKVLVDVNPDTDSDGEGGDYDVDGPSVYIWNGAWTADSDNSDGLYVSTGDLKWSSDNADVTVSGVTNSSATFSAPSITEDETAVLTPYLDIDGSEGLTAGDVTGATLTIKFLNNTGTLLTTVLNGTVSGVATQDLKATVTGPAGVNMTQMDDDLEVLVSRSQTYIDDADLTTNSSNVAETPVWEDITTGYYTARTYNKDATSPANNTVAYSALTSEVIVGQLSPDSKITGISFNDDASANLTENRYVREGTKSFDISAQLYTTDGADDGSSNDAYAKSGVSVKYTAYLDGAQAEGSEIKINGTVITAAGVSVTVLTDSKGVATATITSKNGADADEIEVRADVLTADGIYSATCVDTWYWESVYADEIWETKDIGWNEEDSNVIGTTRNGVVTLNYEITDQFAVPFAKAGYEYQIRVYEEDEGDDTLLATGPVSNGKATVSFTNLALPGSNYYVYGELFQRATNVLSPVWTSVEISEGSEIWVNHGSTIGAVSARNEGEGNGQITFEDFFDYNFNLGSYDNTGLWDEEDSHLNEDSMDRIQGVVVDANNVPVAGAAVTITASGVQFSDHDVWKTGSITVYTNEFGQYGTEWYSHKAGDNLFTVTSGGKTATVTVTLENPTALHATDVLTVNAPAAVQGGTVTPVRVQLVDKYGNGITGASIALGLVGEGYLSNYAVTTDKGAASVVLINGVNDTSTAYISAATAHAAVDANWNRVNKTFTQKVTTGSYATVKASSVKGRLNVVVDNSRNETVRVFVNGKLLKKVVANSNKYTIKLNGLPKGKHKVTVTSDYQNLVTSKSVTIK